MGPKDWRSKTAILSGIIVIIILFMGLFVRGWYYWTIDEKREMKVNFGLNDVKIDNPADDVPIGPDQVDYDIGHNDDTKDVFSTVKLFVIIGIVFAILFTILAFLCKSRLFPSWIQLVVGVIGGIIILIGPIYLFLELSDAMNQDLVFHFGPYMQGPWEGFWGGGERTFDDIGELIYSWGPGWAWYLTFIAGGLLILSGVLCKGIKRKKCMYEKNSKEKSSEGIAFCSH